ncbi:hypothetical protein EV360DRAFT_88785 [Lentinula raphanica]|nr:hypothetical protein EV360DRAFT_88785 [Lentinula raphanica]
MRSIIPTCLMVLASGLLTVVHGMPMRMPDDPLPERLLEKLQNSKTRSWKIEIKFLNGQSGTPNVELDNERRQDAIDFYTDQISQHFTPANWERFKNKFDISVDSNSHYNEDPLNGIVETEALTKFDCPVATYIGQLSAWWKKGPDGLKRGSGTFDLSKWSYHRPKSPDPRTSTFE